MYNIEACSIRITSYALAADQKIPWRVKKLDSISWIFPNYMKGMLNFISLFLIHGAFLLVFNK